ncbi:hypothetical protein ACLIR7_03655 [Nitratireductor aquimarinus]|uniref:hypothetical protein n=1 Tax=Nitratireductor aquimarinus TaxID=889300 RepID=UPI00398E4014
MDAAKAAAETGLYVRLLPDGVMEFRHEPGKRGETPEEYLQERRQSRVDFRL